MIVILTGAGISKESGINTFRDSDGLWEQERIEDVATPQGFIRNPSKVYNFYNARRRDLQNPAIVPNAAHLALARLEAESAIPVMVVTQNIDNLHEHAGTKNLLHMHGELLKARCQSCCTVLSWASDLSMTDTCPECATTGKLRPHIVWFEEMPLYMEEIDAALSRCKIFVSIGTSGNVYPAAGFASHALSCGAHVVELNLEPSRGASLFHDGRYGPATQIVPEWVNEILSMQQDIKNSQK